MLFSLADFLASEYENTFVLLISTVVAEAILGR